MRSPPKWAPLRRKGLCRNKDSTNYAWGVETASQPPSSAEAAPDGVATVELEVSGMHCQSCAALIEETLVRDPGVRRASVDLDLGRASVAYDPGAVSVDQLCEAVSSAGYAATTLASPDPTA